MTEAPDPAFSPGPGDRVRDARPGQWRLATRLTLVVVALLVLLESIVLWTALAGVQERRDAELEDTVLIGQAIAAVVDGFASDLQSTTLATAFALGSQPGPLDQASTGDHLRLIAAQYPSLRYMFLTDPQGKTLASGTGGAIGFDLSSRSYIKSLQAGTETVWSGTLAALQSGETIVTYGRVVRAPDGAPRGFLLLAFYPQQLVERLPITLPEDARITVIDDQGLTVYDSAPGERPLESASAGSVQAALAGQIVKVTGGATPAGDDARFGAMLPIPRLRWAVAYTLPRATVEAEIMRRSLVQASGIALILLLAAGTMILLARHLTRPLTMLAQTAEAIANGQRPTVPVVASAAEIQQLATAMRLMSQAVADREAALLAQREWLRVTLASIGDAVVATDAAGRITFMNEPAATLSGWSESDALGLDVGMVLRLRNEYTGAPVDSPIARVLSEGIVVGLANHTILVTRTGTQLPIDDSAAPIRDASGALIGVVMVFRDVAERRRAEERLRDSQQRLELALQAARMVAWEWDPDADAVTTSANLPEVYGVTDIEGVEHAFGMIHPDDLGEHREKVDAAVASGGDYRSEFRVIRPDTGEVEWREERGLAIVDERRQLRKLHGVVMDITQRHLSEQALRESEERLRLAVGAAPVVLFNHDRDLRYTWIGKPFAGRAEADLLGKTDAELFPPEIAEPAMALKRRALESGERVEGEIEVAVNGPDGGSAASQCALTAEPLRDATGAVIGITCAALDVTERRALERLQQEFISLVSHELRNPLASIKGYAQLVLRRGQFQERAIRSIVQQTDHLDRLISDLLDSSRAAAGRLELRRRRTALAEIVEAAVEQARNQADRHTLRLEVADNDLAGLWDAQRLDQVFTNLLSNAVKYSPEGGEIVVRVARQANEVLVSIQDQGVGIAPAQLSRLFDRFYRVSETAGGVRGLGIGLYVARELVEAHGGRLWAESPGPGQGSTFWVALPLGADARTGDRADIGPILVVDDDDSLRNLIADVLRDEGYRPLTARDGQEALDLIAFETPALILLDWMMPRLGGAEFAAALRHHHPTLDVPLVAMTAGGVAHERAVSIGAAGSIDKPFEIGVLLDQVSRHLRPQPADI
jgi:PAS domain S-box-containing protein